jgi:hypothetical protein
MTTAALGQTHFRGRKDGWTVDTSPEWIANEDTNFTWRTEAYFRLRFTLQETAGGNPANAAYKIQANKNGGAFQDVTTTSTIVRAVDYSDSAEDAAIATKRLSGTGTYVNGRYSEDGSAATGIDLAASQNTELEYGVVLDHANVANADTVSIKLVALSGTAVTITTAITITVSEPAAPTAYWMPPSV